MLKLSPIQKIAQLSKEDFSRDYLSPLLPIVFTDLTEGWPGLQKWTIDFFKANYGELQVPVATPNYSKPGKKYMSPDTYMSFERYLELIEQGPVPFRIFLWNLFKVAPELIHDFSIPDIMDGFLNDYPFMFFGGQGSITAMDTAFSQSPANRSNIDIGHYVAAPGGGDPVIFLEKFNDRISSIHFKDRTKDGGNLVWGTGETPLVQALQLMRDKKYNFPATVELEYQIPEGSDPVKEVIKCVEFCKKALEA